MNIVLAQLKKDVLSQRRSLLLWVSCLALGFIPFAILAVAKHADQPHLDLSDPQKFVGLLSFVAIFMACMSAAGVGLFFLLPILVIRVVHDDTLMGTTAFWLTRPMPRQKLLLAKTLFITVLLLPLLLGLSNGTRVGNDQFWPAEMAWIAAVAALASITPTTQAWIGQGFALLFGKLIFSGIIDGLWNHYHGAGSLFSAGMIQPLSSTGEIPRLHAGDLFHLCYFAGFSAVFVHQYLTLRTRRSLALFIATLAAVGVLQMLAGPLPSDASSDSGIQIHTGTSTGP